MRPLRVLFFSFLLGWAPSTLWALPLNTILFIGDGMGFEQVKAAGMYQNGAAGTLTFEAFVNQGEVMTFSADNPVTDSAAAGTALATGQKVNNGVISTGNVENGHERPIPS